MAIPQQPRTRLLTFNDPHSMRINRDLAAEIGLNESILLLQIEYLISISNNERDGRLWTYQSLTELKDVYFPWWSLMTIQRTIKRLEDKGLLIVSNFNKLGYDRTQWFALNPEGINKLHSIAIYQNDTSMYQNDKSIYQFGEMDHNKMVNGSYQNDTTIPETTTETTQRKNRAPRKSADAPPADQPKEQTPHQAIVAAYADALGYPIPDGPATGAAAKELVKLGYTPEQVSACYKSEKARDFWQDKHLSLQSLKKSIGAWRLSQEQQVKRTASPVYETIRASDKPKKQIADAETRQRILRGRYDPTS